MEVTRSEIENALKELGVRADMTWEQIRSAYRKQVRAVHPDLVDTHSAAMKTARLNQAFSVLTKATHSGRRALPSLQSGKAASYSMHLAVSNTDVFRQFVAAAHNVGEVTYISREDGLINVLLSQGAELLIILEVDADPITALFTLESTYQAVAPNIDSVVSRFQESLSIEVDVS